MDVTPDLSQGLGETQCSVFSEMKEIQTTHMYKIAAISHASSHCFPVGEKVNR